MYAAYHELQSLPVSANHVQVAESVTVPYGIAADETIRGHNHHQCPTESFRCDIVWAYVTQEGRTSSMAEVGWTLNT